MDVPRPYEVTTRMAELARAMAAPRGRDEIFSDVTAAAVDLIDGIDTAGILLITGEGSYESHACTSPLPCELDVLQETFQEGPCLEAALDDLVVTTEDFRDEPRWPAYSAEVAKLGVLSGMSFRLYTTDRTAGALNLFGFEPRAWDAEAITTGAVLAAHAVAAILAGQRRDDLRSELATRDRVGQAKGIIMERYRVGDLRAFEMLRALAQEEGTTLTVIAQRVIDSRDD